MKRAAVTPPITDVLGALIVFLLAGAVAFVADRGVFRTWRTTRAELRAVLAEESGADSIAAERASLAADIDLLGRAAGRATEGLPPAMESFLVLETLAQISRECDVTLDRVTPGGLVKGERFATIPVALAVHGSFLSLVRFLARIEAGDHPVRVEAIELTRGDAAADMNLTANLAVSCLSPAESAAGAAAP